MINITAEKIKVKMLEILEHHCMTIGKSPHDHFFMKWIVNNNEGK